MRILREQENIEWAPIPNKFAEVLDDKLPPENLISTALVWVFEDDTVLLTRHHRGWDIPGGHLDPGETPEEAALREVEEETGADIELVVPVGYQRLELFCPQPENDKHPYPVSYQQFYLGRLISLNEFIPQHESEERIMAPVSRFEEFRRKTPLFEEAYKLYKRLNNIP